MFDFFFFFLFGCYHLTVGDWFCWWLGGIPSFPSLVGVGSQPSITDGPNTGTGCSCVGPPVLGVNVVVPLILVHVGRGFQYSECHSPHEHSGLGQSSQWWPSVSHFLHTTVRLAFFAQVSVLILNAGGVGGACLSFRMLMYRRRADSSSFDNRHIYCLASSNLKLISFIRSSVLRRFAICPVCLRLGRTSSGADSW